MASDRVSVHSITGEQMATDRLHRYFCTTTALQPLYGQLSNVFGRKACLLFAYFVFGAGALFCGVALDMTQLIIARV